MRAARPTYRVKSYSHPKYKFIVRWKSEGRWKRRYFSDKAKAMSFVRDQNNGASPEILAGDGSVSATQTVAGEITKAGLSHLVSPVYTGPKLRRYFGDHWSMHLPFAYELMRELRPRVFVELGVWKGESYFAFCQSAAENRLNTACFGVDTFRGDVHMGSFEATLAAEVAEHNWLYSSFSTLKTMTFAEALGDFADKSIDLLHIDGAHTYEDVRRDFDSWLPKLSDAAIVLFHDVAVRDRGFGVWKLWEEIASPGNSFLFQFGYGLGIWKRDSRQLSCPFLERLFLASEAEQRIINRHYATAASELALWQAQQRRSERTNDSPAVVTQVFAPRDTGYTEEHSLKSSLSTAGWQSVRFNGVHRIWDSATGRLRIDPINCTGVIILAGIRLVREGDNTLLYSAERVDELEQLEFSPSIRHYSAETGLMLLVTNSDPHLYLPQMPGLAGEPFRLEMSLKVEAASIDVVLRYDETLQERTALYSKLSSAESDAAEFRTAASARLAAAEAATNELRTSLTTKLQAAEKKSQQVRAELTAKLAAAQGETETLRAASGAKLQAADTQANELRATLTESERVVATLRAELGVSQAERAQLLAKVEANMSALAVTRTENEQLRTDIKRLGESADEQRALASELASAIASAQTQIEHVTSQRAAIEENSTRQQLRFAADHAALESKFEEEREKVAALTSTLQKEREEAERERATLISTSASQQQNATVQGAKLQQVESELAEVKLALASAQLQCDGLKSRANDAERQVQEAELILSERLERLRQLFATLKEIAVSLGTDSNKPSPAMALFQRLFYPASAEQRLEQSGRAKKLKRLCDAVSEILEPSTGSAVTANNDANVDRIAAELFDADWYLKHNPDVASSPLTAFQHYVAYGAAEGRSPHPLFDAGWYRSQQRDGEDYRPSPWHSYLATSGSSGGDPHPLFDSDWYCGRYPDVAGSGTNALVHYLKFGGGEGRDPHPLFSTAWYLSQCADLPDQTINPLVHFLTVGSARGFDPHPLFSTSWYLREYPDVRESGLNPFAHYLTVGASERRDPNPLFSTSWYLDDNPDVAAAGVNPLFHYAVAGATEGRDPHPLFDSGWYSLNTPEVGATGSNPLAHYLQQSSSVGSHPHPLFDTAFYLAEKERNAPKATEPDNTSRLADYSRVASDRPAGSTVYAFTSICLNYVPKAAALARSLKAHNPKLSMCLLVNEPLPDELDPVFRVFDEVVSIDDLDIPNRKSWIFSHTVVELCTAVKGFFLDHLLHRPDCKVAFYFDPDIVAFSPLEVLTESLKNSSIILTPHLTDPDQTKDAIMDNEICALRHGVYNLGFLGVRPSPEGLRFAGWWRDRLRDFCRADVPAGLFTDQRWIDLAPALFHDLSIVRHPGCNVATWNLTNRHIEGDFERGFTVNGEPLIFYHFSGFDSGAQGAMLNKYAKEAPAAHLLREWYIAETEGPSQKQFSECKWAYGSFDNGEPILNEHRLLYRDRQDLRDAFQDPFATSPVNVSYYHWYEAEVRGRVIQRLAIDSNPLCEFLASRALHRTNPVFDADWYLQHYPDVLAAGVNPLLHYAAFGAKERRKPSPDFDVEFYFTQIPEQHVPDPLAHYLTIGRQQGLRVNPLYDPGIDKTVRRIIVRWARAGAPVILIIGHYGGGGTQRHINDLVAAADGSARFLQLTPLANGTVRLAAATRNLHAALTFEPARQLEELAGVLIDCGVQRIHIHHALGNEHYLRRLVRRLRLPFDFTVHDYYVLAPSPHLIGRDSRFVGEDLFAHEKDLLATSIAREAPSSLAAWQRAHRWLIVDAERVIAPSYDVAKRLQRHFSSVEPIVAAHPEPNRAGSNVRPAALAVDEPLRIAILGELWRHKGHGVVVECARIARKHGDLLEFSLIGDPIPDGRDLAEAGVWISGRYREDELAGYLRDRKPHLLWYPSLCPETYSYTLSTGLASGLPVVVTDIGSFPERVSGRAWTWIKSWQLEPLEWIAFFLEIRNDNFLRNHPPSRGAVPASSAEIAFYRRRYLQVEAHKPQLNAIAHPRL